MTTKDRLPPYEEIEALLPWYVNGTLDSQSMRLVEEALKTSEPLRHALDLAREDRDAVVDANELVPAPRSDVLARVMAEIAADPKTFQLPARQSAAERFKAFVNVLTPRALVYATVAVLLLLAVQTGTIGLLLSGHDRGSGPQLASVPHVNTGPLDSQPKLKLVLKFADTATIDKTTKLLDEIGGRIVDGPAGGGLFVVEVATPEGGKIDVDGLLQKLRSRRDVVEFAAEGGT